MRTFYIFSFVPCFMHREFEISDNPILMYLGPSISSAHRSNRFANFHKCAPLPSFHLFSRGHPRQKLEGA